MIEKIKEKIEHNNFMKVTVNIEGISLYYAVLNNQAYIVTLINYSTGEEFEEEQYKNIIRQIKSNFSGKNFDEIKLLSVVCTHEVDKVKNICGNYDNHWIVDERQGRLIIYENQAGQFLNLREIIEEEISSNMPEGIYIEKPARRYIPICTLTIVALNILIFIIIEWFGSTENTEDMLKAGAMYWPSVIYEGQYYRMFTHMFLHFGFSHIANNMFILFFLGERLEHTLGKLKYLIIYLGAGMIAGIASMVYNMVQNSQVVSAGASGAIFGVVGAMLYVVILNKGRIKDISTRKLIFFVILTLYGGFTSQGTDNMAHIGGFIGGLVIAAIIYRRPKKVEVQKE